MKLIIDISEQEYNECKNLFNMIHQEGYLNYNLNTALIMYIANGNVISKGHGRKFEEIVVSYPPAELCTYPEYKGKPYFSIKYEENGEHIIGYGTYNPEVLSRYLREYFITPTIIEQIKERTND